MATVVHIMYVLTNNSAVNDAPVPEIVSDWNDNTSRIEDLVQLKIGMKKSSDFVTGAVLTFIFCIVFVLGVVGNISVCIVLLKRRYLHMDINAYHANLAVADTLRIIIGKCN